MKTLAIRVSDEDHALFVAVAGREDMPLSTLVRRQLRALAREHGLLVDAVPQPAATLDKPQVTRRLIPQGINAWRDEIYARVNNGESMPDIAESYGVATQLVKDKYKAAKDDMQYHADTGHRYVPRTAPPQPDQSDEQGLEPEPEPALVYDPVDPDNPTEEEQAVNAEIARRKLVAMGFKL